MRGWESGPSAGHPQESLSSSWLSLSCSPRPVLLGFFHLDGGPQRAKRHVNKLLERICSNL